MESRPFGKFGFQVSLLILKSIQYWNFRHTTGNFNIPMAKASLNTIVEVEELVEPGEIQPHEVHIPSVYVKRVIVGKKFEKRIERLTLQSEQTTEQAEKSKADKVREVIARRAALEFKDGMYGK
jgi:3-oxoacid CoA-transferase